MAFQYQQQQVPPSGSTTMFRAVVFNNEGVRRMEHGLYDDAVVSFTNVLETLGPIIPNARSLSAFSSEQQQVQQPPVMTQPQHQQFFTPPPSPPTASTNDKDKMDTTPSITALQASNDSDGHFVFRDPIEIPLDVVPTMQEPSDKLVNKFVVVIMYNLALAVHLSSLECQDFASLTRAR